MRVQPKSYKKTIVIALAVLVSLVVALLAWYYAFSDRNTDRSQETVTSQQNQDNKNDSDDVGVATEDSDQKPKDQSVPHEKEKELPQLYEGGSANASSGLTGVITTKSVIGEFLVIRNTIDQMVNGGTCQLSLASSTKTVTKTVGIVQNPSSSSCAGFDVPIAELSPGQWIIEIRVSSEEKSMNLKEMVKV